MSQVPVRIWFQIPNTNLHEPLTSFSITNHQNLCATQRFGNEVEKGRGDVSVDKAPFPLPASRTGQADFPHPALPQNFTAQSLQQ
ncbi:MAG: hypothetical protein V1899_04070, partial [Planctomycetota bacterium]